MLSQRIHNSHNRSRYAWPQALDMKNLIRTHKKSAVFWNAMYIPHNMIMVCFTQVSLAMILVLTEYVLFTYMYSMRLLL